LKLFKKIVFSAFIISVFSTVNAFAYDMPETIRVGLEYKYKEVESVSVKNEEIVVGYEEDGEFVEVVELEGTDFVFSVTEDTVADLGETFDDFDDAQDYADEIRDDYGVDAVVVFLDIEEWGVYAIDVSEDDIDDMEADEADSDKLIILYDDDEPALAFDGINPQIMALDNDEIITLSDRSYRDVMEFGRYNGKKITAVNVVEFDHYLYSAVPSEMPSTWEEEAIKAQTVAARSYALTRMTAHNADGYDVCDGINCQVYMGYGQEKENVNEYIDDTDGKVALYDDEPINAVFFSSSGGSTDNSENVWTATIPYLRAVKEINEEKREWTRTFSADEIEDILDDKGINIGSVENMEITETGKYGRVQEITIYGSKKNHVLKEEECRNFFSSKGGSLISRMFTINGEGYSEDDEEDEKDNEKETEAEEIVVYENQLVGSVDRTYKTYTSVVNGYTLTLPEGGTIFFEDRGTAEIITVKKVIEAETEEKDEEEEKKQSSSDKNVNKFVIEGAGSGHGVGMSQFGAQGMAKEGYDFEEILEHYYTDITIE